MQSQARQVHLSLSVAAIETPSETTARPYINLARCAHLVAELNELFIPTTNHHLLTGQSPTTGFISDVFPPAVPTARDNIVDDPASYICSLKSRRRRHVYVSFVYSHWSVPRVMYAEIFDLRQVQLAYTMLLGARTSNAIGNYRRLSKAMLSM